MQEQLEATLAKLISIPSMASDLGACREIIEFIRHEFEPLGFHITYGTSDKQAPWLMITTQDTKALDIMLAAHVDVVPAIPSLFKMEKIDNKLYGRGVYDMKFAAACYIEFAKKHATTLRARNIGFLFTTDEEVGGSSVLQVLQEGWRTDRVFLPDGGDDWKIEKRAKGFFGVELIATGTTGHGSRPWEADNAIHKLFDICHTLRTEYPPREKSDATLSINAAKGGHVVNQIADHATVLLDFRSFDRKECEEFESRVKALAAAQDVTVVIRQHGMPLTLDETDPRVQGFFDAMRAIGKEIMFDDSYGGTDGRFFAQYDIPVIIVEPHGGGRHAPSEWLLASDLEVYCGLLERWVIPTPEPQV